MPVLTDTCVWIDHLHRSEPLLVELLELDELVIHPLIIGELTSGNLPDQARTIADLRALPPVRPADFDETLELIEARRLHGRGLHWNDLQLLASTLAAADTCLWTRDRRLLDASRQLRISFREH